MIAHLYGQSTCDPSHYRIGDFIEQLKSLPTKTELLLPDINATLILSSEISLAFLSQCKSTRATQGRV